MIPGEDFVMSLKAQWCRWSNREQDVDRDLIHAASRGLVETVSMLAPSAAPAARACALWQAAFEGRSGRVRDALLSQGAPLQSVKDGMLCRAAQDGNVQNIFAGLECGADIHNNNDLPLFLAASNGREQAVLALLNAGADAHRAFNVYTLRQLREKNLRNPALDIVERAFLSPRGEKPGIGFRPEPR